MANRQIDSNAFFAFYTRPIKFPEFVVAEMGERGKMDGNLMVRIGDLV